MKRITRLGLVVMLMLIIMVATTGCVKPVKKPIFEVLSPSETGFLVNMMGDNDAQAVFESREALEDAKIPTREVEIAQRFVNEGRMPWQGYWKPTEKLIKIDRKPVTRSYTADKEKGTSTKDEGFEVESQGSITFVLGINVVANIQEEDAVTFAYKYGVKPLEQIIDQEVKATISGALVQETAKRNLDTILLEKEEIMNAVRDYVIPMYEKKGITISVLELTGSVSYEDEAIQEAINAEFKAKRLAKAQVVENAKNIKQAQAEKEAKVLKAEGEAKSIEVVQKALANSPKYIEFIKAEAWNGKLPQYMLGDTMPMLNLNE